MSKRRLANGRNDGPVRYVRLDHYMLKTEAWKALGAVPRAILIEIKFRYNGTNNGRIPYSIREAAAALKIGKSTAGEAFDALQAKGFIAAVNKGTFHRKIRHATEWRLTEYACNVTSEIATKEFTRWRPVASNSQKPVPEGGLSVPEGGPFGTHRRTDARPNGPYGT